MCVPLPLSHAQDHNYYRWKVFSLTQGDRIDVWKCVPLQMQPGGPFFLPPPCPALMPHHPPAPLSQPVRHHSVCVCVCCGVVCGVVCGVCVCVCVVRGVVCGVCDVE